MEKKEYVVLCPQVIGSSTTGFNVEYNWDDVRLPTYLRAKKHGFKVRGSDDFNIGVLLGGKLVALQWMDKQIETTADELAEIIDQIGL